MEEVAVVAVSTGALGGVVSGIYETNPEGDDIPETFPAASYADTLYEYDPAGTISVKFVDPVFAIDAPFR